MRINIRRGILALAVAVPLVYGGYYGTIAERAAAQATGITASGTIEAKEITIAAQAPGRVKAVSVDEGDEAKAGALLVQLDDTLLQAQRRQAEASVAAALGAEGAAQANQTAAQAQLDQLRAGARPQEIAAQQAVVAAAQGRAITAQAQLDQAHGGLQAATAQRDQAVAHFAQVKQGARPEQIQAAAVAYQQAAAAVQVAQANYDKIRGSADVGASPQALALQQVTLAMEAAKSNYQGVLAGATSPELTQARAAVDQAVAGILQASAAVSQTSAALTTARANQAGEQARLDLLKAGSPPEQIKAAEAQVAAARAQAQAAAGQVGAAQAAVALVDDQIAQMGIHAPADGMVLSRGIEPGEVALTGATLLTLGDPAHLTLTVYLPEDAYGRVRAGDVARVNVDSFPGNSFAGTVTHIADQAEFTPRNVQTPAGRRTTVFAVKLAVDNPGRQLKPGMPADVLFTK